MKKLLRQKRWSNHQGFWTKTKALKKHKCAPETPIKWHATKPTRMITLANTKVIAGKVILSNIGYPVQQYLGTISYRCYIEFYLYKFSSHNDVCRVLMTTLPGR